MDNERREHDWYTCYIYMILKIMLFIAISDIQCHSVKHRFSGFLS